MLVPKLRFKGFKDEWKEISLKKIFTFFYTNSLSRADLTADGLIKNIHYGDIHQKFNNILDVEKEKLPYINPNIELSIKDNLCQNGDLIFADASEDYEGIGKAIEIINIGNNKVVSGLHTIHARDIESTMSIGFKGYLFNTPIIHNQIRILANGFKVFGISKNDICNLNVRIPNKMEQEKIANLLSLLDKKIELQKRRIEALKIYKRGFIMQILKDDNTNSKNYHISECINIFDKRTTINNQYTILSSTQNGLQIQNDYFNRQTASENNIGYKIIPRNYITYRSMSDTGDFYFNLQNVVDFGIVSPAYPVFRTSNFVDIHYFLYYLNYSSNMKRQILLNKEGGTRFALSINKLSDIHISLPSYETQINHSYIFRTLDKKINLGEQKLHKLNLLKTSLLQQMFI